MSGRALLVSTAVVVTTLALLSSPALAFLEVHHDFSWEDDGDREMGNGYNIDLEMINQYPNPIWVTNSRVHMDWQEPDDYFWGDGGSGMLNPGDTFYSSIFVQIPGDTWEGEHGFDIYIQMDVDDGNGTHQEDWQEFRTGFYVEPASGGTDGDGDGDGWNMSIDVDWSSFGTGIDPGGFAVLMIVVIISCVVVIPVVYHFCKTW